ncbi:hypothetical protein PISMIDRAFT_670250 [Pisolithus microcarpus 441]|uniref:Uncharacterized protein n=1 Tax=Pisolithus microcarpus 441 TaxID=765257 RepID=A0A0C9ZZ10_9AGAM|nr:hypothetical protein PISMIDRAFT_670250 [Pisolithus microcarpus 441]
MTANVFLGNGNKAHLLLRTCRNRQGAPFPHPASVLQPIAIVSLSRYCHSVA